MGRAEGLLEGGQEMPGAAGLRPDWDRDVAVSWEGGAQTQGSGWPLNRLGWRVAEPHWLRPAPPWTCLLLCRSVAAQSEPVVPRWSIPSDPAPFLPLLTWQRGLGGWGGSGGRWGRGPLELGDADAGDCRSGEEGRRPLCHYSSPPAAPAAAGS